MTTALPNLASMSDGGFVELVWENGQLLLRGASTTTQKSPSCIGISSHTSNAVENVGGDSFNTKSARYESRDSPLLGPPALKELSKHDKNMPYLNYPHIDSLQEYAYLPELLNESYEPTPNALTQHYDAAVLDKSCRHDKQLMDSNIVSLHDNLNLKQRKTFKFLGAEPQLTKPRSSQLYRSPLQHCQSSAPFTRITGFGFHLWQYRQLTPAHSPKFNPCFDGWIVQFKNAGRIQDLKGKWV
ncbi:hypothetical protein L1049_004398 [Liquidambar formosana]|uniref:Uncharacterized protein n=1 Tax=Liquidambar formosana TaxID=63359 RepID=A0AAP0RTB0_LIQFO